jgi:hypothetical protein
MSRCLKTAIANRGQRASRQERSEEEVGDGELNQVDSAALPEKEETMDINMLNPNDPQEREVGVWLFRLSTAHADRPKNLGAHKRWLAGKLEVAVRRATGQQEQKRAQQRRTVDTVMSVERAKAETAFLEALLSE